MGLDIYFHRIKEEEIGYFRKVNFLVTFFEDRGYEVENLRGISISEEDANELLRRCNEVLNDHSKAPELLPTQSGFFFGGTEYDDYYFDDVKEVKKYVENTLLPEMSTLRDDEHISFKIWY